jgi:hypothetical protein
LEGRGTVRLVPYEDEPIEIPVPESVRTRAEEIVQLSRRLGDRGVGFSSSRDVLAPALVYGLAHMRERYSQAALRAGRLGEQNGE